MVDRVLMQLMALAWVHHYGAKKEWRTLLRLPAQPAAGNAAQSSAEQHIGAGARLENAGTGQLSAGQVRQQYRLMSTLVHPDKCQGLACADEAFVLLSQAQQHLLDALGRKRRAQEPAGLGRRQQRQRTGADGDVAGAQDSSDGDGWSDGGADEEEGFQWWGRWDLPRDAELFPSTEPSAEEEADSSLWEMSLQVRCPWYLELPGMTIRAGHDCCADSAQGGCRCHRVCLGVNVLVNGCLCRI